MTECERREMGEEGEVGGACDRGMEEVVADISDCKDDETESTHNISTACDSLRLTGATKEEGIVESDLLSRDDESVLSSSCTVATTTSYLHGDRTTVQRLVARGLRKKQQQIQRKVRPKKAGKTGGKKSSTKSKGKRELQQSIDSEW